MKIFLIGLTLLANITFGATKNDPHLPISHCYHWINEGSNKYLSFKYNYASEHENELTFYTTPASSNGSVAGPGLYCAKSPSGSYSYGDRLIRVELVDDIVLYDEKTGIKHCGLDGVNSNNSSDCGRKNWDIKFYNGGGVGNSAWYVIQNPEAIKSWSSNSDQLIKDLQTSIAINDSTFGTHAQQALVAMSEERKRNGIKDFHTQSERSSIIKLILEQPDKLKSIPAFNVISRLSNEQSDRLSISERKEIYLRSLEIALQSNDTDFNSYAQLFRKDKELEDAFYSFIQKNINRFNNYNQVVFLEASLKNSLIDSNKINEIVSSIFKNKQLATNLSSNSIIKDKRIKDIAINELKKLESLADMTENLPLIINLIDQLFTGKENSKRRQNLLTQLQSENNSLVKIIISNVHIGIDPNQNNQKLCKNALKLVDKSEIVKFKYFKSEFHIATITDDNSIDDICNTIDNISKSLISIKDSDKEEFNYTVTGRIESTSYFFIGANRDQIISQCYNHYKNIPNPDYVDEIYWSLNGSSEKKLYNKSEFWKTKNEVCGKLVYAIASSVPSKAEIIAEQKYNELISKWIQDQNNSKAAYKVTGKLELFKFFFFGESQEEIRSQCNEIYQYIPNPDSVDEIYISLNGSTEAKLYNSSSFWKTQNEVCNQVINSISSKVPTKKQIQERIKYNLITKKWRTAFENSNAKYKVSGRFDSLDFYFFGLYRNDIIDQCHLYYDELINQNTINTIYYAINGGREQRQSSGYRDLDSKSKLCNFFDSTLNPDIPSISQIILERRKKEIFNAYLKELKTSFEKSTESYSITGKLGDYEYYFTGNNSEEIAQKCSDFQQSYPNRQEALSLSVNINKTIKRTDRHVNISELCSILAAESTKEILTKFEVEKEQFIATEKTNFTNAPLPFNFELSINGEALYLNVNHNQEIGQKCINASRYLSNLSQHNQVTFKNENNEDEEFNIELEDYTVNNFCAQLEFKLLSFIPTKEILRMKEEWNRSTKQFKLSGVYGMAPYYFAADSAKEFGDICEDNFDMLKDLNQDTKVEIFKWKVEGATTTYTVSSSSTLRSRRSLCKIFERNLKKQL